MSLKARTAIIDYEDTYAIELGGGRTPQERDRLTDQGIVIAYDRVVQGQTQWRLRAIHFDRDEWTRSGVRRWWATHEVRLLAEDAPDALVPEICREYSAPQPSLPTILLCHRNTPLLPAREQVAALRKRPHRAPSESGPHRG